jgi:hypothetical protein
VILIYLRQNNLKLDKLIQTLKKRSACSTWSIPRNEDSMSTTSWETSIGMREVTH